MQKWKSYVKGDERRQQILSEALSWVSKGAIKEYMSAHRKDNNITELKTYFETVIDWASGVFDGIEDEMCGLEWGRLYEMYHKNPLLSHRRDRILSLICPYGIITTTSPSMGNLTLFA